MNEFNPYEAPQAMVEDLPPAGTWTLADRGSRLGAAFLDGFIWLAPTVPLFVLILTGARERRGADPGDYLVWEMILGAALIGIIIWNLLWLHQSGQTIGKRVLSIRIVRSNGERASLGRLFWMRGVLPGAFGAVPFLGRLFSLVDTLFIFREDRRCIHDHLADTIVIQV